MNIKDIAVLAGVSKSTVSRVINHADNVDEKTRQQVLKVVEEYDFLPSAMARGLSSKGNNVIGLILPDVDNAFFGQVTQGINEVLLDSQYTMILCCTGNNPDYELRALQTLRQQRVKGILATTSAGFCNVKEAAKIKQAIENISVPVVLIDRAVKGTTWNGVYSDNTNGAYAATSALIEAGFREIGAFISDMPLSLGQERYSGFLQAIKDYRLEPKPELIHLYDSPASSQVIYKETCRLIEANSLPEAVFLGNNIITNGFYKAILEKGIAPGKDIHCIGFDYSEILDIIHIPFSYLERNCKLMGQTAMKLLLKSFEEPSAVREECIIPAALRLDGSLARGPARS
ncbi:MAG: LacI family transcriptional regulator [Clostridium sp.]|nr:LacI family transcriptional regulator [Clostridium sp.]